jgi:site-specific recombinase XerD
VVDELTGEAVGCGSVRRGTGDSRSGRVVLRGPELSIGKRVSVIESDVDRPRAAPRPEDLVVTRVGGLEPVVGAAHPVRLLDGAGREVEVVTEFLRDLVVGRCTAASAVSYAKALLRWWRFLAAVGVGWDRAEREHVRDFVLWIRSAPKPQVRGSGAAAGSVNSLTGKAYPGRGYAPRTINHNLTVIAAFYDFHASMGHGPVRNPVPVATSRTGGRVHAHHNWMEPFTPHRRADYRQKVPKRIPRGVPDERFNDLFAAMSSHRDRAILAFYVSTGARASELLGLTTDRVDVGSQLIGVIRKGSRALQWLPASTDAFVWLRLFQQEHTGGVVQPDSPVWCTLRRPYRPLTYGAMRAVMLRANERLGGANWSLHDLRHTAAKRMLADPSLSLSDVQWVLGHAQVTTTQIYLEPSEEEVIRRVREHHRQLAQPRPAPPAPPSAGYRAEVLDALLGAGYAG